MDRLIDLAGNFWNGVQVLLGLSFVILVHELGHFVLAKWNGVKVERFSLGFPPNIFSFRKGETEYVVGAVLLGGYVSLFGEGPDEEGSKSTDPRAFPNKSVAARMSIMSAGVVMNLVLGLACFIYAYGQGMEETSDRIGAVLPGSPAYRADVRTGDQVVSIDGRTNVNFLVLLSKVRLSRPDQVLHFVLRRPGQEALIPIELEPRSDGKSENPAIGVLPFESLTTTDPPYLVRAGLEQTPKLPFAGLKPGDRIVAVGPVGKEPTPVSDSLDFHRITTRYADLPLNVVVVREEKGKSTRSETTAPEERLTLLLLANRFVDFGFRLKIEPIASVQRGSVADKAGFRPGDVIVKVDGSADFDPMRLPSTCYDNAGKPMTFQVERRENGLEPKLIELTATPDESTPWSDAVLPEQPLDVPGLGLAYQVRTSIAAVTPGSPAEKAGLKAGDFINAMTIPGEKKDKKVGEPLEFKFDEKTPGWASAFQSLQLLPLRTVSLTVRNSNTKLKITPEPDPNWFHPNRGVFFQYLLVKLPPMGPSEAITRGFDDTVDNILNIYATLRGLVSRRLPMSGLAGPITIVRVAYAKAGSGLTELIHFFGILSINLAVLNFLPIPPLDGGQMVYLLAEGVRGRPIPDSAKFASFWVGVVLVLTLMGFVLVQDVVRW